MKKFALLVVALLVGFGLLSAQSKKTSFITFEQSFLNQTGTPTPTVLLTPTVDEDFTFSLYVENITPQTGTVCEVLSWTDDNGVVSQQVCAAGQHGAAAIVVHAKANDPIQLSGTDFGNGQTYDAYVTAFGF